MADLELRRLHGDVRRASEELVERLENYGKLVPSREIESKIADDVAHFARFVERQFRGWYERSRDVREMLEDPGLRPRK